ncbi:hypothetical protein J4217_02965 [Candidatus Pacearchaeota archaeon]|nr:hypothetical protein [Candidatus Pacearchaeota archaeon]
MRLIVLILFLSLIFIGSLVIVNANDILTVEANIFGLEPPRISVNVPDYIFVGNASKETETDKVRVDINNTGNVAIVISPELVNESDEIFSNLYFARRAADSYKRIGSWSMNVSAPTAGGVESDYMYMKLDLRNFDGNITEDRIGKRADVRFIATAQ